MTRPVWRLVAFGVVAGWTAVACGGSGSKDSTSSGSGDAQQFGSEEFGLTMDELASKVEEVEGLIGECMADAGFEYVPVDFERVKEGMDSDKSAPGLNDEEFVAQYGFGITTQLVKPGREIGLGEQNIRIYEALSPNEQVAYNHTLLGENLDATFALSVEAEDFSLTGGCTRMAVEQAFTPEELTAAYINPADVAIEQDERVLAAVEEWSACVADGGFDYPHPDAVEEDLAQRFRDVTQGEDAASLTGPAADALAELQGEEVAVAGVATKCEEDVLDPVIEDVETEIFGAPQA